jgi:hypothetical protein
MEKVEVIEIPLPGIEILAAFRMSHSTAVREGFPRTADQVQGYLDQLLAAQQELEEYAVWAEWSVVLKVTRKV